MPLNRRELPAAGKCYLPEKQCFREEEPLTEDNEPPSNVPLRRRARDVTKQLEQVVATHGGPRWSLVGGTTQKQARACLRRILSRQKTAARWQTAIQSERPFLCSHLMVG